MHYYSHPAFISWLFSGLNKKITELEDVDPVFAMIGRLNLEVGRKKKRKEIKREKKFTPCSQIKKLKKLNN